MHRHRSALGGFLLLVTGIANGVCGEHSKTTPRAAESADTPLPTPQLRAAIDRSAHYLAGRCDAQGQFIYRTHLDPQTELRPAYNVLRHAGAVFALAQYCQHTDDPDVRAALRRAAGFLRRECMSPLAGNANLWAVWSEPERDGNQEPRQAKLGGAGLGLVALVSVERLEPGSIPLSELRALGRFLIFMQKSDGSFYSKYFPDSGRNDIWQSDYYPGEAALGLLMLHAHDPAPQWIRTAAKALNNIAERGAAVGPTFPDQWFLLATERMLLQDFDESLPVSREILLAHARRTCVDMLNDQERQMQDPVIRGCFTADGRSCPTATRLEGLLAAQSFLALDDPDLNRQVRRSIERGMKFLLQCQITEGPHAGAIPRVMPGFTPPADGADHQRAHEVRIDYVQHALSAMIRFEAEFP
ncbi:MAG: hypothetical protein ACYC0X_24375 [Pirellulaceae bacterium]